MNSSPLLKGILFALVSSLLGSIFHFALSPVLSDGFLIKLLISTLNLSYLVYLFSQSEERIGRLSVLVAWFLLTLTLWYLLPSILLFTFSQLITIWLVRSLYFYSSVISSLIDLALNGVSLTAALWASHHTNSLFLTIWCFFITQAFFVLIPTHINNKPSNDKPSTHNGNNFQQAYRAAESAIKQLSTQ